jgi:hypothetical protein
VEKREEGRKIKRKRKDKDFRKVAHGTHGIHGKGKRREDL